MTNFIVTDIFAIYFSFQILRKTFSLKVHFVLGFCRLGRQYMTSCLRGKNSSKKHDDEEGVPHYMMLFVNVPFQENVISNPST
jgi:hypothetical protein